MIGFLVTMENMYRNEHVTHVFKFINKYLIPIIGIYRLAVHAHVDLSAVASEIPEM